LARGELARVRPLGLGGRALALAHGFLTCRPWQPHGAQWLESTGAAAQARHSGACRCARTCTTAGRQNPRREHAKMCVISTPVHSPGASRMCKRLAVSEGVLGAQGPSPRGKVTVPGCSMAARAARSR
jgi:hypothetical protein